MGKIKGVYLQQSEKHYVFTYGNLRLGENRGYLVGTPLIIKIYQVGVPALPVVWKLHETSQDQSATQPQAGGIRVWGRGTE